MSKLHKKIYTGHISYRYGNLDSLCLPKDLTMQPGLIVFIEFSSMNCRLIQFLVKCGHISLENYCIFEFCKVKQTNKMALNWFVSPNVLNELRSKIVSLSLCMLTLSFYISFTE